MTWHRLSTALRFWSCSTKGKGQKSHLDDEVSYFSLDIYEAWSLSFYWGIARLFLFINTFYSGGGWPSLYTLEEFRDLFFRLRLLERAGQRPFAPKTPLSTYFLRAILGTLVALDVLFYIFFLVLIILHITLVAPPMSFLWSKAQEGWAFIMGKPLPQKIKRWLGGLSKKLSPLVTWASIELDIAIGDRLAKVALLSKEIREVRELAEAEGFDTLYKIEALAVFVDRKLDQGLKERGGLEKFDEEWTAFRYSLGSRGEAFLWLCRYYKNLLDELAWDLLERTPPRYMERAEGGFFNDLWHCDPCFHEGGPINQLCDWLRQALKAFLKRVFRSLMGGLRRKAKQAALHLILCVEDILRGLFSPGVSLVKTLVYYLRIGLALFSGAAGPRLVSFKEWLGPFLLYKAKGLIPGTRRPRVVFNPPRGTFPCVPTPAVLHTVAKRLGSFEALARGYGFSSSREEQYRPSDPLSPKEVSKALFEDLSLRASLLRSGLQIYGRFFFRLFAIVFRWALTRGPLGSLSRNLTALRRAGGRTLGLALDWPRGGSLNNHGFYKISQDQFNLLLDFPLVGVANLRGPLDKGRRATLGFWKELGAAPLYWRVGALIVGLFSASSYTSTRASMRAPSLRGELSEILGAVPEATGALKFRWPEKKAVWDWSLKNSGLHHGCGYRPLNSHNISVGRPKTLAPRWATPLKGRHITYTEAFSARKIKIKFILDLVGDSLSRPPHAFQPNRRETKFLEILTVNYYRPPFQGVKPIMLGRPFPGTEWLFELYKAPFESRAPLRALTLGRLEVEWARTGRAFRRAGLGSFLNFLEVLKSNLAAAPARCRRFWKNNVTPWILIPLKTVFKTNYNISFNTRKYFSYFLWKNTHPCTKLSTVSTEALYSRFWGALRPSITPLHLAKYGFFALRFGLVGYRLKTRALPLLKTHLWLHYFYPIAGLMGVYPSFLQPGTSFFDMGGGTSFFITAYRLTRAIKKAIIQGVGGGYTYSTDLDEALVRAAELSLNSRPSLGLSQAFGLDSSYGFGGYWGSAQTSGLVDTISTIRPFFKNLESSSLPMYTPFSPYPTAPLSPSLEKLISVLSDRFSPRSSVRLEAIKAIKPPRLRKMGGGTGSHLYKNYRGSPNSPHKWEEGVRGLSERRWYEGLTPKHSQHPPRGWAEGGTLKRAEAHFSPNLRWGNSLYHKHMGAPYNVSRHDIFKPRRSRHFRYPEEAALFSKRSPSYLGHNQAPSYANFPTPRVSALYSRYNSSPTNGFLLKEKRRRGGITHFETHPSLQTRWTRSGVSDGGLSTESFWNSRSFNLPTHPNHEFKAAVFDILSFFQGLFSSFGKYMNETFFSWMAGPEYLATFGRLALLPARLLGVLVHAAVDGARLDLLPDLGLKTGKDPLAFFSVDITDSCLILSLTVHTFYCAVFFFKVAWKALKLVLWWVSNPSNAFWFGWGGLEKVGEHLLPPLRPSSGFRLEPPSCPGEPPSGLTAKWAAALFFLPPTSTFFDYTPKPLTAGALYLGRYASFGAEDPAYNLSGWPRVGRGSGFLYQAVSVARETLEISYDKAGQKRQAWIVPVWVTKLLYPGGPWDHFVPCRNDCFYPEWRGDDTVAGFWSIDGAFLDDAKDQIIHHSEVAPYFLSWEAIKELGILNVDYGLVMNEFILPLLFPQEVARAVGGRRLSLYHDLTCGSGELWGRTFVKGDLLDWPSPAWVLGGSLLVWLNKNWPPYGIVEPLKDKVSYFKGPRGFLENFIKFPPRRWWGGGPLDEEVIRHWGWDWRWAKAMFAYWTSPLKMICYHYPHDPMAAKSFLLLICSNIFALMCAASFLSPILGPLLRGSGPLVGPGPSGYSSSYGLPNAPYNPREAEAGVFDWLFYFFPRVQDPDGLYEGPTRLDLAVFTLPYIRSAFLLFKERWGGGQPYSWLDKDSYYALARYLEYRSIDEEDRCLRGEWYSDSAFFFWPDFFYSTDEATRGLIIDFFGSIARGLFKLHLDLWLWHRGGAGIDPFGVFNDVDRGKADYYYRAGPAWYDW